MKKYILILLVILVTSCASANGDNINHNEDINNEFNVIGIHIGDSIRDVKSKFNSVNNVTIDGESSYIIDPTSYSDFYNGEDFKSTKEFLYSGFMINSVLSVEVDENDKVINASFTMQSATQEQTGYMFNILFSVLIGYYGTPDELYVFHDGKSVNSLWSNGAVSMVLERNTRNPNGTGFVTLRIDDMSQYD